MRIRPRENNEKHPHEASPNVKSEFDLELTFWFAEGLRVSSEIASSSHDSRSPDLPVKILEPDGMATVTLRELLRFRLRFGSPRCDESAASAASLTSAPRQRLRVWVRVRAGEPWARRGTARPRW